MKDRTNPPPTIPFPQNKKKLWKLTLYHIQWVGEGKTGWTILCIIGGFTPSVKWHWIYTVCTWYMHICVCKDVNCAFVVLHHQSLFIVVTSSSHLCDIHNRLKKQHTSQWNFSTIKSNFNYMSRAICYNVPFNIISSPDWWAASVVRRTSLSSVVHTI